MVAGPGVVYNLERVQRLELTLFAKFESKQEAQAAGFEEEGQAIWVATALPRLRSTMRSSPGESGLAAIGTGHCLQGESSKTLVCL